MNKNLSDFLCNVNGKWIAIGGNRWIKTSTENKVRKVTESLIKSKYCIVTGGAEGVDHTVMKTCFNFEVPETNLKIFLPYTIEKQ